MPVTMIDHEDIKRWAERNDAHPAWLRQPVGDEESGALKFDFEEYWDDPALERISWDDWLRAFDDRHLALVVDDADAESRFNRLVPRDSRPRP